MAMLFPISSDHIRLVVLDGDIVAGHFPAFPSAKDNLTG